jgi:hypothetical protein
MGTRNITCVVKDGQYRVAQYGQWDGYPEGQGQTILEFLLHEYDPEHFREQIDKIVELSEEEIESLFLEAGAVKFIGPNGEVEGVGFVDTTIQQQFVKGEYGHLSRDCGAEILHYINNAETPRIQLDLNFAADGLMCEWCYVIDLDTDTLEVYMGFGKTPLEETDRFYFLMDKAYKAHDGTQYYPVKIVRSYAFSELTETTMKELEKELSLNDNDDDE